jgi:hypothetical protein
VTLRDQLNIWIPFYDLPCTSVVVDSLIQFAGVVFDTLVDEQLLGRNECEGQERRRAGAVDQESTRGNTLGGQWLVHVNIDEIRWNFTHLYPIMRFYGQQLFSD